MVIMADEKYFIKINCNFYLLLTSKIGQIKTKI